MLLLDSPISLTSAVIKSPNICAEFTDADLQRIGASCAQGLTADEFSRMTWMRRNEAGMDLALQISEDKNFPWPGASNVKFPLVTIAAMQFHARAYPAIINGRDVVKCAVNGPDPSGEKTARSERVSTHMSWQVMTEDRAWEEQEDRTLFNVAIVGTAFKKSYHSASLGHNVSELVMAKDLVIDYWARSIDSCPRKTHLIPKSRNEIYEAVLRGTYRDVLEEAWYKAPPSPQPSERQTKQDNRQGTTAPPPDESTSFQFGEQHVRLDLDGDGYAEPWIITFDINSKSVLRIVAGFEEADVEKVGAGYKHAGEIIRISNEEYFTKRSFIPSPDGGIYDIGFGVFLGPLNESVNTAINQIFDAGSMQTAGGGFLARGAKIRGGVYTIAPGEWKRVDSTGDDLRKSMVPAPANEPSAVLFQLLSLLINYTNRIAGTTDMMVGENPGQNTPAQTSQTMVEQGGKIYSALFKRIWRNLADEFQKLYLLNKRYCKPGQVYVGGATSDDYLANPDDITPAADPNEVSDSMRLQKAMALKQIAATTPGYDKDAVEMRVLKAMQVDAPEQVFHGSNNAPPPEDPKVTIEKMRLQFKQAELQQEHMHFIATLLETRKMNNASIIELQARADQEAAKAQVEAAFAQVAQVEAMINQAESEHKRINDQINSMIAAAKVQSAHELGLKKMAKGTA